MRADEILEQPFRPSDVEAAEEFVRRFEYSTTALYLIAQAIRTEGEDEAGAELVDELVKAYAEHEAGRS